MNNGDMLLIIRGQLLCQWELWKLISMVQSIFIDNLVIHIYQFILHHDFVEMFRHIRKGWCALMVWPFKSRVTSPGSRCSGQNVKASQRRERASVNDRRTRAWTARTHSHSFVKAGLVEKLFDGTCWFTSFGINSLKSTLRVSCSIKYAVFCWVLAF